MDWRNCVDRFSQTMKSAYSSVGGTSDNQEKMMPPQPTADNSWLGKNVLGKFITCSSGQSRNSFVDSNRQNSLLMHLNSQGETINTEEDLAAFPVVCPQTPKEMHPKNHYQHGASPGRRGWQNPHMGKAPKYPGHGYGGFTPTVPISMNHVYMQPSYGQRPKMQYPQMPSANGMWNNNMGQFSWLPHISPCIYNMPVNSGNTFAAGNVYRFQGNHHQDYRDPHAYRNHHAHHKRNTSASCHKGRSPRRNWNRNSQKQTYPSTKTDRPDKSSHQAKVQSSSSDPSSDVINKMSDLSISSEKLAATPTSGIKCNHDLSSDKNVGSLPTTSKAAKDELQVADNDAVSASSASVDATDDLFAPSATVICKNKTKDQVKSSERIDDAYLAFELCGSPSTSRSPVEAKVLAPVLQNKKEVPKAPKATRVHASCLMLTPKTSCVNGSQKKKKSRPSAKKRRRQKLQRCGEGQIIKVTHHNKKQKTEPSNEQMTKSRSDSLSFVIDFSESEISEAETLHGTSPADLGISPVKFSLFINAADLSTDSETEDSSSDSESDSDFFDEDTVDCASVQRVSSKQANLLSDFDFGLSPVTLQIHYQISNPSGSSECRSSSPEHSEEEGDQMMLEESARDEIISEANCRWQSTYSSVAVPTSRKTSKVSFAVDPQLVTVHTLRPDEVELYREARKGHWEEYARDRERFKNRIADVSKAIAYCLEPTHRDKIRANMTL